MLFIHRYLFPAMWMLWAAYWWIAARDTKQAVRRESLSSRLSHLVALAVAVLLLWLPSVPIAILSRRFLPETALWFWIGAAVVAAGLAFAVWARLYLGRNWSGTVAIMQDHRLIMSGPYAAVRHPIYTGLLLAFFGSALARGDWRAVVVVAIASWSLWRKLRIEERWLSEQFGDAYTDYRKRVAALVPLVL